MHVYLSIFERKDLFQMPGLHHNSQPPHLHRLAITVNSRFGVDQFRTGGRICLSSLACYAPSITLIPSTSTLASRLPFRRSQQFYLSSIIDVRCHQSTVPMPFWRTDPFSQHSLDCILHHTHYPLQSYTNYESQQP